MIFRSKFRLDETLRREVVEPGVEDGKRLVNVLDQDITDEDETSTQ